MVRNYIDQWLVSSYINDQWSISVILAPAKRRGDPKMNLDWIESAFLIVSLALVLRSWWEFCDWSPAGSQDTEDDDCADDQVDPSGEGTCVPAGQDNWDFLELLDFF